MSTVRRPGSHREFIREVSKQTTVMRLQGFLFFGTIAHVEEKMRTLVAGAEWHANPVRFLILDLSLVAGVDLSAAEAFVRVPDGENTALAVQCSICKEFLHAEFNEDTEDWIWRNAKKVDKKVSLPPVFVLFRTSC